MSILEFVVLAFVVVTVAGWLFVLAASGIDGGVRLARRWRRHR